VIGGYTVAEDGSEKSLPDVAIYDPVSDTWSRGADIPVPTDDAAAGIWGSDRIVLVSGWHDTGNIPNVQIYHPAADRWTQGTDILGVPVFGHTGTMVGDDFVYVDGTAVVPARPRFALDTASWRGRFSVRRLGLCTSSPGSTALPRGGGDRRRPGALHRGLRQPLQLRRGRLRRRAFISSGSGAGVRPDRG